MEAIRVSQGIRLSHSAPVKLLTEWMLRINSREKLKTMSDRMLLDVGLTREQVEAEIRKPFWRA